MRSLPHSFTPFETPDLDRVEPVPFSPTDSLTTEKAALQLTRGGYTWKATTGTPVTLTYAFRDTEPASMPDDTAGFSRFNGMQIAAVTAALQAWADVANITFVRVSGSGPDSAYSNNATLLFGNYATGEDGAAAFAYLPNRGGIGGTGATSRAGDVWVNATIATNAAPVLGNYGYETLVHEIGHALGLEHPGDYDAVDGTEIVYERDAGYYQDTRQYTVMSYFSATKTGADYGSTYPAAPQLHDIAAIQRLYGASTTAFLGDTVYGFNSNTGRDWLSTTSNDKKLVFAVWDSGGNDTFDFSGYTANQTINLQPGIFISTGGLTNNIAIPLGVVIENLITGSGNDILEGNSVANVLSGGAGDDHFFGYGGDDLMIGGPGSDSFNGGDGSDTVSYANEASGITVNLAKTGANAGVAIGDAYFSVENVIGTAYADTLIGNSQAAGTFNGRGNNSLYGMGGDDRLIGGAGNDLLDGGSGVDVAVYGGLAKSYVIGVGTITGAATGTDRLVSIENLPFIDGRMTYDVDDPAAQLNRLYDATLHRTPDSYSVAYWLGVMRGGTSLTSVTATFVGSQEFQNSFGTLTNQQFIQQLYRFTLGREGEAAGVSYWTGELNAGKSRAEVVVGFSESQEHRNLTAPSLQAGLWVQNDNAVTIARLYDATFDRLPDGGGLTYWKGELDKGTSLTSIAATFAGSQEFQNRYGALSNQAFVEQLYRFTLDRAGEAAGVSYWTAQLNSGTSRASVLLQFSDSTEHAQLTQHFWDRGIQFSGGDPGAAAPALGSPATPDAAMLVAALDPAADLTDGQDDGPRLAFHEPASSAPATAAPNEFSYADDLLSFDDIAGFNHHPQDLWLVG